MPKKLFEKMHFTSFVTRSSNLEKAMLRNVFVWLYVE